MKVIRTLGTQPQWTPTAFYLCWLGTTAVSIDDQYIRFVEAKRHWTVPSGADHGQQEL